MFYVHRKQEITGFCSEAVFQALLLIQFQYVKIKIQYRLTVITISHYTLYKTTGLNTNKNHPPCGQKEEEIMARCSALHCISIMLIGDADRQGEMCISCGGPSLTRAPFTAVTLPPPHHHHLVNKGQAIRHLEGQLICHPSTNVSASDLVRRA